jgi:hypothetical protein
LTGAGIRQLFERLDRKIVIRVDTQVAGDLQRFTNHLIWRQIGILDQGARR